MRKVSLIFILLLILFSFGISAEEEFKFGETPVSESELIKVDLPQSSWITIGAPIATVCFFFGLIFTVFKMVPYKERDIHFNLHDLPVAAQRGIGMAVVIYGFSFAFAFLEAEYQIALHGSAELYFHDMGLGKLIAITHAHLNGLTTSFFIIGIPFSLHFYRLRVYQLIFPTGLAATLTDIISWWGIKYISAYFEYIAFGCGFIFSICYIWMLIGLIRIIFFPNFHWFVDYINNEELERRTAPRKKKID